MRSGAVFAAVSEADGLVGGQVGAVRVDDAIVDDRDLVPVVERGTRGEREG